MNDAVNIHRRRSKDLSVDLGTRLLAIITAACYASTDSRYSTNDPSDSRDHDVMLANMLL